MVTYTAPTTAGTVTLTATSVSDGTKTGSATITVTASTAITVSLSQTTATVPVSGTSNFTATVANDSANKGVSWTLAGAGCSGGTCGALSATSSASGAPITYTAPAAAPVPPAVTLTATSVADNTKTAVATITVSAAAIGVSVTVTPSRGGLTLGQSLNLTATVANDVAGAGVTWSASSGTVTPTPGSTTAATFVAPASPGVITISATSKADGTKTATATIGVTDLATVETYHNDISRDGANLQEYALTPTNVNANTFGKLFSCAVDGAVYAQPLWLSNVTITGAQHNIIVVATAHDSMYVFDADANPCVMYWHANLIDAAHGGTAGETSVPSGVTGNLVGEGYGDITPETGIIGTPVIDPGTGTIYVVTQSSIAAGPSFFMRLHAIDTATGAEKLGGPVNITAQNTTFPGTADGGTTVAFNPQQGLQRAALALSNGVVYICFASHEDKLPYYGWVVSYNAATLAQIKTFATTPILASGQAVPGNGMGGVWMSGGAPSIDPTRSFLYLITGNGVFGPPGDYGDSFLKLNAADLSVSDSFTPFDQSALAQGDKDLGAGGAALLINLPSTAPHPQLLVGGGKGSDFAGKLYVLDPSAMGGAQTSADTSAIQSFSFGHALFSTGAFWQNTLYVAGVNGPAMSFPLDPVAGKFPTTPSAQSTAVFNFPGSTPSVSAQAATNGIVWLIDSSAYGVSSTQLTRAAAPAILRAYSATDLTTELWDSNQAANGRDTAGNAVKFTVPTVANGKVYIGTRGNDDSLGGGSTLGELDVYGLLPN
jgi:acyl-coenzyme A thioesterase PaaI-like protein